MSDEIDETTPSPDARISDKETAMTPNKKTNKLRMRRLIAPRLQLRLTAWFLGLSTLALVGQFILMANTMSSLALELPGDPATTYDKFVAACLRVMLLSMGVVLPLTLAVGVMTTFRIAGPVHNFKKFLTRVQRGERPEDCRIRAGDEFQDLCELLNDVTAPLRTADGTTPSQEEQPAERRVA